MVGRLELRGFGGQERVELLRWLGNIFWNAPRCQWQVKLFVGKNLHKMKVPKISSHVTICSFQVGFLLALHFPLSLIDEPLPHHPWSAGRPLKLEFGGKKGMDDATVPGQSFAPKTG